MLYRVQFSLKPALLFACFLILYIPQSLLAQCGNPNWELSNDCGDIQASGGLAINQPTIFCAGETVIVENNSNPVSEITMTYIDWDDGTCEAFNGMPTSLSHAFIFPNDTCFGGSGLVTFTVRLGVEKNCGNASSFNYITFPIAVRFKPIVIATTSSTSSCTGTEIDFMSSVCANGTAQYQWVINNDTFTSHNVPNYVFDNPGIYNVTLTVTNSCGSGGSTISVVSSGPATAEATASVSGVCVPDTVVFQNNSTNANGYTWVITPAGGWSFADSTNNHSPEPAVAFTSPGDYLVTLQVDGCGDPEWSSTITVLAPPEIHLDTIPDGCDTGPLSISPVAVIGGSDPAVNWTFAGGSPGSVSGMDAGTISYPGVGTYIVTATVAVTGCGMTSASDTFSILSLPMLTLSPVSPICNSAAPIQLAATPSGGGWTGPGVSPGGLFNPRLVTNNLLNTAIPFFYQYGTGECLVRDTLFIQVNGNIIDAGPDQSLCVDAGLITLAATPAGGVWTGEGLTGAGVFDPVAAGAGPHVLAYTFVDPMSNCTNSDTIIATVQSLPEAVLDNIQNICVGESFDFGTVFGGAGASSCHWDFGDGTSAEICGPTHTYNNVGTYNLRLFVENLAGCRDTAIGTLEIVAPPVALFSTDVTEGCADLSVTINNQSGLNGSLYVWDFGNGTIDTLEQPGTLIFGTGEHDTTYIIVLQAVNQCGAATAEQMITVHPRPQVRFGTDISNGCSPLEVHFNNVTVGEPDFYQWYINGIPSSVEFQLPPQTFSAVDQDSTYYITLVAGNGCGIDTVTHSVLVKPNPVQAFFNTDTLSGCQPFNVQLIDYSTNGLNLSWDLGDGNLATGDTVMHTFQQAGQYNVREFVTNGCGFDTATALVTVLPQPVVSFEHSTFGCQNDTLFLQNTSPDLAGSFWNFGDGTGDSTNTSPAHVYTDIGIYTITLTGIAVTSACPATASHSIEVKPLPTPVAAMVDSFGCEPFVLHLLNNTQGSNFYVWNFGNGAFSTEKSPTYTYTEPGMFHLSLQVTDLYGCKNNWSYAPVNVFPKPTALFNYNQATLCVTPAVLQLQNQSLDANNYLWNFGPLGGSLLANPSITVNNPMTLPVQLMAENMYHCRDTTEQNINIYTKPDIHFTVEEAKGCSPLLVFFENESAGVNQYAWDFGDGGTSSDAAPIHIFQNPGHYKVTLYAAADSVCFDSLTRNNFIQVLASPTAGFTYEAVNDSTVNPNGIIRFFDASLLTTRWHWDFGDGDTSAIRNPAHRYYENGPQTVTLIVYNGTGCSDTLMQEIIPESFGALYMPNAISPEAGEPGTRIFQPTGAGLAEFEVSIFTSNGQRVWHTNHLQHGQPDEYWDGTLNGKLLPQGLYWWKGRGRFTNGRLWEGMKYGSHAPVTEGKVILIR